LVYDNSRTRDARETFRDRRGNCLSFTTLFVAMARYAGLGMQFQEVYGIPATFDEKAGLMMVNRHVNAAVVIQGHRYVVDFNPDVVDWLEHSTRLINDQEAHAQYLNNLGAEALSRRQGQQALELFQRSLSLAPTAYTWANLGAAYSFLDDLQGAEESNLKALQLDRHERTAMLNLSQVYRRLGRLKQARRYQERAEKFRRKNPYFHYRLGKAAYSQGRFEEAAQHFRDAIKRKSEVDEFHFALARASLQLGDLDQVRKSLKKALRLASDAESRARYSQKLDLLMAMR
jgi:tetratricopeptide (TPR) repeat protein